MQFPPANLLLVALGHRRLNSHQSLAFRLSAHALTFITHNCARTCRTYLQQDNYKHMDDTPLLVYGTIPPTLPHHISTKSVLDYLRCLAKQLSIHRASFNHLYSCAIRKLMYLLLTFLRTQLHAYHMWQLALPPHTNYLPTHAYSTCA